MENATLLDIIGWRSEDWVSEWVPFIYKVNGKRKPGLGTNQILAYIFLLLLLVGHMDSQALGSRPGLSTLEAHDSEAQKLEWLSFATYWYTSLLFVFGYVTCQVGGFLPLLCSRRLTHTCTLAAFTSFTTTLLYFLYNGEVRPRAYVWADVLFMAHTN